MEYRAPKNVVLEPYQPHPVLPETHRYWGVSVRVNNLPEPEPNNFTGPHGRLKWINPVPLHAWTISPASEEAHTKAARLYRRGWHGAAVSFISPYEDRAIERYLDQIGRENVYAMRPVTLECTDERPGDIGTFEERTRSFYFAHEALRDGFLAFLKETIPPRTVEMYVDPTKFDRRCHTALRGLNYIVFKGQDAGLLTVEEKVSSAALMMIRLACGVAKPT